MTGSVLIQWHGHVVNNYDRHIVMQLQCMSALRLHYILRLQDGSMMELETFSNGGLMHPSRTLRRGRTV